MIALWAERLAFLGALTALVLALLWPHVSPVLSPLIARYIINPTSTLLHIKGTISSEYLGKQIVIKEHPRFNGGSLTRLTSDKESIYSTYRSLEGFGQSPLTSNPSFSMPIARATPPSSVRSQLNQRLSSTGGEPWSLRIFTGVMVTLIVYIVMKTLTSRFDCSDRRNTLGGQRKTPTSSCFEPNYREVYKEIKDLRQDKRRFAKMSRDERARELILHHGGRNVSSAIRFLVGELEKQKHLLFKNLSDDLTCNCSCHTDDVCESPSPSKHESLDKLSKVNRQR